MGGGGGGGQKKIERGEEEKGREMLVDRILYSVDACTVNI